jgi:hypothetical protein
MITNLMALHARGAGPGRSLLGVTVVAIAMAAAQATTADAAGPAAAGPTMDDLAWMAGRWSGESKGTAMEEHWTDAKGGLMLGLHREVAASGRASFEFLRIAADGEGVAYLASPMGREATSFPLVSASAAGKRAVFENPDHDFPQRIIYWLGEDAMLHARVETIENGAENGMEWAWSLLEQASPGTDRELCSCK